MIVAYFVVCFWHHNKEMDKLTQRN